MPVDVATVGVPHASVAVAVPSAPSIAAEDGLHPSTPFAGVPPVVITGAVTSTVQVAVRDVAAVLPHSSTAVNVLVCERRHPLDCILASDDVTVGVEQASVAVAEPKAALIAEDEGLQPKAPFAGVPDAVTVGGTVSVQIST